MIVYYNHKTGDITGVAWDLIPYLTDPHIETDDPIVSKFTTGEARSVDYKVTVVDTADSVKTQIVPKPAYKDASFVPNFKERVLLVPKTDLDTDITIEQSSNSVRVRFNETAVRQWKDSINYKDRGCVIMASTSGTPYFPIWTQTISLTDLDILETCFDYDGLQDVRFFLSIPFTSVSHKTTGF